MLFHRLTRQAESTSNMVSRRGNSRIIAAFQEGRALAGLRVSFDALKAGSANDERLPTLQRWQLKERNGNRFSVEVPLAVPAASGAQWGESFLRYRYLYRRYSATRYKQEPPIPKWVVQAVVGVTEFCHGIKYYSATIHQP